jgi:ribosome-associated protein
MVRFYRRRTRLETIDIAHKIVDIASEKQAEDILLLDARGICSFTDYLVICSCDTGRQMKAVYDEILTSLKDEGITPHHHEGEAESGWLLLDYGAVVAHIFAIVERDYYQLDRLWQQASPVVRIQ